MSETVTAAGGAGESAFAVRAAAYAARFEAIRQRTLDLVSVLDWPTLRRQHVPILSPMVWDLGHIGNYEETWIAQQVLGEDPVAARYQQMFDPVANPRPVREQLPLPERDELLDYLERVRARTRAALARLGETGASRLLDDGFVFELVAEHEEQHQETLLQAMQLLDDPPYSPIARRELPAGRAVEPEMVEIAAGPVLIGRPRGLGFAYDNEQPRHAVDVAAFAIDRFPVSNAEYLAFVEDGGYRAREVWSEAGWTWLQEAGVEAPGHWRRDADGWVARYADRLEPIPNRRAVVHIGFYEAAAYAAWAGKRLPTEAEWEKAALWDPEASAPRSYPWGDRAPSPELANLDQLAFAPAEVGAFPAGASAYGVEQMIGDVWEWTATDFHGYPGFEPFPYREYSEIFFGDEYKVLRGGSWATRPDVARGTFRNWDFPIRRQIFAGVRCARSG